MGIKTLITFAFAALVGTAAAQDNVSLEADIADAYVWRGKVSSMHARIQPTISLEREGVESTIWIDYDLVDGNFMELDYTASKSQKVGPITVNGGFTIYAYPKGESTIELNLSGQAKKLPFSPKISLNRDFMLGNYAELEISESVLGVDGIGIIGYDHNYSREGSGFSHAAVEVSFPLASNCSAKVGKTIPLDSDFDEHIYAGLNFKF